MSSQAVGVSDVERAVGPTYKPCRYDLFVVAVVVSIPFHLAACDSSGLGMNIT